jgi:hypothetical protein
MHALQTSIEGRGRCGMTLSQALKRVVKLARRGYGGHPEDFEADERAIAMVEDAITYVAKIAFNRNVFGRPIKKKKKEN